jgi:hypothetical protein
MNSRRHGRACPGHPDTQSTVYRDGRDKRRHDAERFRESQP